MTGSLPSVLAFMKSKTPAHELVLPAFRIGFSPQLNFSRKIFTSICRGVFPRIPNPAQLLMERHNHCRHHHIHLRKCQDPYPGPDVMLSHERMAGLLESEVALMMRRW